MANDVSLPVRRAIIPLLRADAALVALVPAERIYPEQPDALPEWPFVRYGTPTFLPDRSTCGDGGAIRCAVHSFAKGPQSDEAAKIARRIAKVLDDADLTTEDGEPLTITVLGGQTLSDDGGWHVTTEFEALVG